MQALGRPLVETCCKFIKWRGSGDGAVYTQHYSTNRSVPVGHIVGYSADCSHTASAHGPCLNVNALVHTDGHAHVTGRASGRGYASREYFDRPQVRRIPSHLCWLSFWTWWTQNELRQSDAHCTQSTDREQTASVPTARIEVSCVCHVCYWTTPPLLHVYTVGQACTNVQKSWNTTQNSRRQKQVPIWGSIKIRRYLIS